MHGSPTIDEFPVELANQPPDLSENYALVGGDPAAGLSIFCSIGRWYANRDIWRQLWFVVLPDNRVIFSRQYGRGNCAKGPNTGLGGINIIRPGQQLHFHYDGPAWESDTNSLASEGVRPSPPKHCIIAMEFSSSQPVWDMHGGHSDAASIAGRMHYEQLGRLNGSVTYNNTSYSLSNGFANRDHSRGARDVSRYCHHIWASATFDNGDSFQLYAMQSNGSASYDMQQATFIRAGKHYAADIECLSIDGNQPTQRRPSTIKLNCELGLFTITLTRLLSQVPVSFSSPFDMMAGVVPEQTCAVCLDGLMQYDLNGSPGIGWCEIGTATGSLAT